MDNTLTLWELASGGCLRTFTGHTRQVLSVCLSADALFAVSGSKDKTVKLWHVQSGRCLRTFEGHGETVSSVCLSADGRYALSGSSDTTMKLWDVASGHCLRTFEGHERFHSVDSVYLSVDGRFALSGSSDKTLKLWDVASGCCLRTLEGHTGGVTSLCLSADGRLAISGSSSDKTLNLWGLESGRCLRSLQRESMYFAGLSADGRYAVSLDGAVNAWFLDWDLEENEPADWDEGARPYLDVFLRAHRHYAAELPMDRQPTDDEVTRALTRVGTPTWTHEDWLTLLKTLQSAGYGWLRPEGVGRELARMAAGWRD